MSRRHKLGSEASARFERGVDPELPVRASARAATMLAALSGGTVVPGCSMAGVEIEPVAIAMAADYPDQVAGLVYGLDTVLARLREVGCTHRPGTGARLGAGSELGAADGWRDRSARAMTTAARQVRGDAAGDAAVLAA